MVGTRHSSKRFKAATLESALFNADILASIAPYLAADDLAHLSATCRHFGGKQSGKNDDALTLVQEVARQMMVKMQTEVERAALVRYPGERWIALYHQLVLLRSPLQFDRLIGKDLRYVNGDKSRVMLTKCGKSSAFSNLVMRGGKHYVEFSTTYENLGARVGIIRPIRAGWVGLSEKHFDPIRMTQELSRGLLEGRSERWGESNISCCMYSFLNGFCVWSDWQRNQVKLQRWDGWEGINRTETVLGLLLDLDGGTLSVYKDGRRLGVMQNGLSGEYCWVASFRRSSTTAISIRRAAIPNDA